MSKKEKYLDLKKSIIMLGMVSCGAASLVGCNKKEQVQQEDYDMVVMVEENQEDNLLSNDSIEEYELLNKYTVLSQDSETIIKNVYGINYKQKTK